MLVLEVVKCQSAWKNKFYLHHCIPNKIITVSEQSKCSILIKILYLVARRHFIYICNSGFDLMGNEARVCQGDGSWNGSIPQCVYCRQLHPQLA